MRLPRLLTSFTLALTATLAACAPEQVSISPGERCPIAEDQTASFMPPIEAPTTEVILDSRFTASEMAALEEMVLQWNSTSEKIGRPQFFQTKTETVPTNVRNADPRKCETHQKGGSSFYIVKETSDKRWEELGFGSSIPGATVRCTSGTKLVQQIIYINPKLVVPEQFPTVALHELGHALGLDHSCIEGTGKANYAGCAKLTETHPYRIAVMYPTISRGSSRGGAETRDMIRRNDGQRTQCLYKR